MLELIGETRRILDLDTWFNCCLGPSLHWGAGADLTKSMQVLPATSNTGSPEETGTGKHSG